MVSTRTMSNVTGGGESTAGPSRPHRHHDRMHMNATVTPHDSTKSGKRPLNLFNMPQEIMEHILSYLPHRTIGHLRQVCRLMDVVCGRILNHKFQHLQTRMLSRFQAIKAQMPRRESARRNHPLACESDIIETLHMRLTLLQMTFGKHIERKHCCFFAGEILDEVYRILHYIRVTPKLARPYKVTDELFDLSTMAMEYFKEHIEPALPDIAYFGPEFIEFSSPYAATPKYVGGKDTPASSVSSSSKSEDTSTSTSSGPPQSNMVLRKRIRRIKQGMKRYNNQLSMLRRDLRACKGKVAEQQKQIIDYSSRLDECDRKNEETSRKFSTLLQELNKCKTELQYWRSKSPANPPTCRGCGKPFVPAINEVDDLAALANQGVLPWLDLDDDDDDNMEEALPGPSNAGGAIRGESANRSGEASGPKDAGSSESKAGGSKSGIPKEPKGGHLKEAKAGCSKERNETKSSCSRDKNDSKAGCSKEKNDTKSGFSKEKNESKAGCSKEKHDAKAGCSKEKNDAKAGCSKEKNDAKAVCSKEGKGSVVKRKAEDASSGSDAKKPKRVLKPRRK